MRASSGFHPFIVLQHEVRAADIIRACFNQRIKRFTCTAEIAKLYANLVVDLIAGKDLLFGFPIIAILCAEIEIAGLDILGRDAKCLDSLDQPIHRLRVLSYSLLCCRGLIFDPSIDLCDVRRSLDHFANRQLDHRTGRLDFDVGSMCCRRDHHRACGKQGEGNAVHVQSPCRIAKCIVAPCEQLNQLAAQAPSA